MTETFRLFAVAPSVEAVIMPTANVNSFHVDRWPAGCESTLLAISTEG